MTTWVTPSKPEDVKHTPWLSKQATARFEGLLQKDMTVIEFGAGGSTLWLAERVGHVTSYENDPDWGAAIRKHMPANVTLYAESLPRMDKQYDLMFIDGEPVELRGEWLKLAPSLLKPGGILVLDNCNRPEYEKELAEFAETATLIERVADKSLGTRYTVTDFYQCKRA